MFSLKLLGGVALEGADGSLTGRAVHRHPLALLAMLAASPHRRLSRDKLIGHLWPDSDAERARSLVKQAVYNLRKAMGEGVIAAPGDDLQLNFDLIRVDIVEFEDALAGGDPERAVTLYQGPFLDGFFLSGSSEFEDWSERERKRLADSYAKALETLAEAAEQEGNPRIAAEWWKARAAHDPYDSRIALRLMQSLEASGNRAAAIQHAAVHERLLQEEFGVTPAADVLALAERLRHEPPVSVKAQDEPPVPIAPEVSESAFSPPAAEPVVVARRRLSRVFEYGIAVLLIGAALYGLSRLWNARGESSAALASEPSIAVLPLTNHSTDPHDALLADGMTEELIAVLAQTRGLRVIASTSVFSFQNRRLDARSIADSLDVDYVLEGTLRKSGSHLRVQVRLVDGSDGATRWARTYDRELRDVFQVQDEITGAVAGELGVRFAGGASTPRHRQATQSVAAYELYLRGSDRALLRSDSTAREALQLFEHAIALDSNYAAAWAGLARLQSRLAASAPGKERARLYARAEQAARKAVALDDSLAEAHAALGAVRMHDFDYASAETHLTRALSLDPSRALTHEWLMSLYLWTGQPAKALAHAERALAIDPLSPYAHAEMARALLGNDRCDEALARLQKLSGLQPPLARAASLAAQCYARKEMWPQAIDVMRPQAQRGGPTALAQLGYLLGRGGQKEEARRILATLLALWRRHERGAFDVALVHAGLGEFDQAFAFLDNAIDDHSLVGGPGNHAAFLLLGPHSVLRGDPRFTQLRARLRLQNP